MTQNSCHISIWNHQQFEPEMTRRLSSGAEMRLKFCEQFVRALRHAVPVNKHENAHDAAHILVGEIVQKVALDAIRRISQNSVRTRKVNQEHSGST